MKRLKKRVKTFISLLTLSLLLQAVPHVKATANHDELFVLIGDSLMKAKESNQAAVSKNIEQFEKDWKSIKKTDSKKAIIVDQKLADVKKLLVQTKNSTELSKRLSALSSAVVVYDKEQNPEDKTKAKEQVEKLIPMIQNLKALAENNDHTGLTSKYQVLLNQWNASEKIVHDESISSYGNVERNMALIRIAITQDPPNYKKATKSLDDLNDEIHLFLAGKVTKQTEGNYSLTDLSTLLGRAEKQIAKGAYQPAAGNLNKILTIWTMVEGDVKTRDSRLYSDIETKIPTAISLLSSENVDAKKALAIVKDLNSRLAPLLTKTDYSIWDASLILLREGLEGLLIVATLLAFLRKMGQSDKQKWIWAGVGVGILASASLAIVINIIFSKIAAASSREYIEGITGIVAVIMMLTIGAWLHQKSNIGNWNKFLNQQMQQAIAKGSLFSFALISFLSVFREGAETIIFYAGITPYISLKQLVIGILIALVLLVMVGFSIIKYSVKIPIRLFFTAATILIYLLAFKILGVSIHAMQISKVLSTTTMPSFPFVEWIGFYPTLETSITQLVLLILIVSISFIVRKGQVKSAVIVRNQ